jgi:hypothetical protein
MKIEKKEIGQTMSTQIMNTQITNTMKRISLFAFGATLMLGCLALPALAQNQPSASDQPSGTPLGDYAKKVRKEDQGKAKSKVFDNDNLPREDKLSVVGTPSSEDSNTSSSAAPEAAGEKTDGKTGEAAPDSKSATSAEGKAADSATANQAPAESKTAKSPEDETKAQQAAWQQWQKNLSAQKEQIDLLSRELDVLQREYQIRAADFYADAGNRLRNQAGWDKQDTDYKQQIADKQKALDDAKQKLDDMDEEARKAGVPASMRE